MSEIGSISVSINGDASGLLSAAASAQAAVTSLNSAINGLKSQNVSVKLSATDDATPVVEAATKNVNAFGTLNPEASLSAIDNTGPGVASAKAAINSIQDKTVVVTVKVNKVGSVDGFAEGTTNAPGGLARINDEKGIADPRELIYHGGNYYLFEGRDVLLPLDKGDKVFTASQTKQIMRLNGVPSYASGKNNELFDMDKRSIKYVTKTSEVPLSEQIEMSQSALEAYAYDAEAVMECEEEIFSLTQKLVKEINGISEIYIDERSKLNDWEKYGDTAIDAFNRVRDRNSELLSSGIISWEDYYDTVTDLGADMYAERIKHSENWLEQQYKYNNLSVEDYIAGLERMREYTEEYYKNGLIGDVDYFYGMQDISNQKFDMRAKGNAAEYKAWKNSAEGYLKQRETYDDWDEWGDNLSDYYDRCIQRQQEFFDAGKIDWETYNNAVISYKLEQYKAEKKAAENAYKDMLSYAKEYISGVKADFKAKKDELSYENKREELQSEHTKASITKLYYENAVTQKGKDVYAEADEKMKKISREMEELSLEREQSETLAVLEKQYSEIEKSKTAIISNIMNTGLNMDSVLDSISIEFSAGRSDVCTLLTRLISAVQNSNGGNVYGGTTYNITGADSSFIGPLLKRSAAALSGFGG